MAARFEYAQAEEIRDIFGRHDVHYLFLGKSGAILLGFPDTTQDADVFVEKSARNGNALVIALRELGFDLTDEQADEIRTASKTANRSHVSGRSEISGSDRESRARSLWSDSREGTGRRARRVRSR